jgi:hypothetical protein
MNPLKIFPEENFKEIIEEIGPWNYRIYDKGERMPGPVFKRELEIAKYNCVVAGTGCTISDYTMILPQEPEIVIPGGEPIMIIRLLRYDDGHGDPHYNANDQILFPAKSGTIYRLLRNDAPDHFIEIAANSNIASIAEAYNLPEEKSGPVVKYSAKGGKLHIDITPLDEKKEQERGAL